MYFCIWPNDSTVLLILVFSVDTWASHVKKKIPSAKNKNFILTFVSYRIISATVSRMLNSSDFIILMRTV